MAIRNPRTEEFVPVADPLAVLERDCAHRQDLPDGAGSDLYTIDQALALAISRAPSYPTVAPGNWDVMAKRSQMMSYNYEQILNDVNRAMPSVHVMLNSCPGFVLGGSAAIYPLASRSARPRDIDIYMIDAPADEPADEPIGAPADTPADAPPEAAAQAPTDAHLWRRLHRAVSRFTADVRRDGAEMVRSVLTPGLLTLHIDYARPGRPRDGVHIMPAHRVKVQFVLRAYRGISALLHAVDGIAPVAYDGRTAYTTTLGAYELARRLIVVDPSLRSVSYETRLLRYFNRGFALQFPHMNKQRFGEGVAAGQISLGVSERDALQLKFVRQTGGDASALLAVAELRPDDGPSDYDPELSIVSYSNGGQTAGEMHTRLLNNWRLISTGATCLRALADRDAPAGEVLRRIVAAVPPVASQRADGADGTTGRVGMAIDAWADGAPPPTLKDLFSRERCANMIEWATDQFANGLNAARLENARDLFMCGREALAKIALDIVEHLTEGPARRQAARERVVALLNAQSEQLLARYDALAAIPIDWWITVDPGRQWTAAHDPRAVSPADWYGPFYEAAPAAAPAAEQLAALEFAMRNC